MGWHLWLFRIGNASLRMSSDNNQRSCTDRNKPSESGWMIDVPCNKFKEIVISSYDDKEEIRNIIIAGIKKNIANAVADKKQ